jgi:hypothetical protein
MGAGRVLRRAHGLREDRRDQRRRRLIIGVDGDAYHDTFYDSFGNVHRSRPEIDGDVHHWIGVDGRTRCTVTMADGGMTQIAHHESSVDGVTWTASMDVVLRKVV